VNEALPSRTENKIADLVLDDEGYYRVVLSHFGRPNVSGDIYRPLVQLQLDVLNEKEAICGELGQPVVDRPPSQEGFQRLMSVELSNVAIALKDFQARDLGEGVQEISARVQPWGPKAHVLEEKLASGEGSIYFGMRAVTEHYEGDSDRMIYTFVSWDLIDFDPYPPKST
jgi:hypothetical protein